MKKYLYIVLFFSVLSYGQVPTQSENYIRTKEYKLPTLTPVTAPTILQASQNVIYYDGLGRPIQNVAFLQSANSTNIITHYDYDDYGRQSQEYLPYSSQATGLDFESSAASSLSSFYNTASYQNTTNPFSQKVFEASPLNRVIKQTAPGTSWALGSGNEIEYEYQTNSAADNVLLFTAVATWNSTTSLYEPLFGSSGTTSYTGGSLYKTITKDENWTSGTAHTTEEYKNREGQVVLKRTYAQSFVGATETYSAHDTYYVYDQFGNLTYVIPPLVNNSTITQPILDELCYQYKYDVQNRLVEKKIPGKQWEFMVYDNLDRVVATGPALSPFTNFVAPSNVGWMITKYDKFNRPIITAWLQSTTVTSLGRVALQNTVNTFAVNSENKSTTNFTVSGTGGAAVSYRYTNIAWPTTTTHYILTVDYYDDYTSNLTFSPAISYTFTGSIVPVPTVFNNTAGNTPKGLPTMSWVRVPETISLTKAEKSYTIYDTKGRAVRNFKNNYLNGYVNVDSQLENMTGRVNTTIKTHRRLSTGTITTVKDNFTFTGQERLSLHANTINTLTPQLISFNSYNLLGELTTKRVGGINTTTSALGLQKIDYKYNVRGWLTDINPPGRVNVSDPEDLFHFNIKYDTVDDVLGYSGTPLFNGNISEIIWSTNTDLVERKYAFKYDELNRLRDAFYQKPNDVLPTPDSYNEIVRYDKNGNIKFLDRTGTADGVIPAIPIDQLTYDYQAGSNKLVSVTDGTPTSQAGFIDGADQNIEYEYDAYGNMTKDLNKGIVGASNTSGITYNHLNLPTKIIFNGNTTTRIDYLYNALGQKVRKIVTQGASSTTTDYLDGFQYTVIGTTVTLDFFPHAEGYVTGTNGYVFQHKDHLGNVRMSFTDTNNDGTIQATEVLEENHYYPFGLKHSGYNGTVNSTNPLLKYKYNGKEFQNELNLNFYDYGARNYDPAIGRWMNIDPLAETSRRFSPYVYALNNPVYFIDPDGMEAGTPEMTTTYAVQQDDKRTVVHESYTKENNKDGSYTIKKSTLSTEIDAEGKIGKTNITKSSVTYTPVEKSYTDEMGTTVKYTEYEEKVNYSNTKEATKDEVSKADGGYLKDKIEEVAKKINENTNFIRDEARAQQSGQSEYKTNDLNQTFTKIGLPLSKFHEVLPDTTVGKAQQGLVRALDWITGKHSGEGARLVITPLQLRK